MSQGKSEQTRRKTIIKIDEALLNPSQLSSLCIECSQFENCVHASKADCLLQSCCNTEMEPLEKGSAIVLNAVQVELANYLSDDREGTIITLRKGAASETSQSKQAERILRNSIFQAQERERKLISRELHDGVGQSLFGMLLQVELLATFSNNSQKVNEYLERLQGSLKQTIEEVRNLSAQIRPSTLDDFGLVVTLRHFIEDFGNRFGMQINLTNKGCNDRLPVVTETALYRIAQEALINAAKYSGAERIDIVLELDELNGRIVLQIRDFGKGFEINSEHRTGIGIYSMEERANLLNGDFQISSELGVGTLVQVAVPYQK